MFKDMTLGQYFPGNSFLHRADPRVKLVALVVYLVFVLLAKNACALGVVLVTMLTLAAVSRIPFSVLARSLKPVVFILLFTGVLNLFLTTGETPLVEWKFIHIYPEGVRTAVYMMLRLVCLVGGSSLLLSYTTSPLDLTIALRFIPTLTEETDKIISAQKARGADFESGGLVRKAKAIVPILIPLFVSAFRRADELAEAMECRCYHGGEGRTKLKVMRSRPSDYAFLLAMALLCAGVVLANRFLSFEVGVFSL